MRWLIAICVAALATANPALSAEHSLEDRIVQQVFFTAAKVLEEGESSSHLTGTALELALSRGENPDFQLEYTSYRSNKALAACIVWAASGPRQIAVRFVGLAWRAMHMSDAEQLAIFTCQSAKAEAGATDCKCALVAKNDKIVVKVPADFLARASGD